MSLLLTYFNTIFVWAFKKNLFKWCCEDCCDKTFLPYSKILLILSAFVVCKHVHAALEFLILNASTYKLLKLHLFFKICFVILCVWVFCLRMCMCTPRVLMPVEVRRRYTSFITRDVDVCELPCGCWESNSARTASTFNSWAILSWESITNWMTSNNRNKFFQSSGG